MRLDLTPASHRVLVRASRLRLQRGIAAISSDKLLWALFEEDECRAAQWLLEAGLSLELFGLAFGIQTLRSPITAPSFPVGSYGISAGQHTSPAPLRQDIDPSGAGNNSPVIGNPFPEPLSPDESESQQQDDLEELPQDAWVPCESPKYSLYSTQGRKPTNQSRFQFYLDDQKVNIGLLAPELEEYLETVAHRFVRQDRTQSISVAGGTKQIAIGTLVFSLTTEHLLLAMVLDNGEVGRYLRDHGFDAGELYRQIEGKNPPLPLDEDRGEGNENCEEVWIPTPLPGREGTICRPPSVVSNIYRLLDAAANRGREAIRVLEDYVRFILDDADLTQRFKTFRHQFQNVSQLLPMESRLEARNTESDVGTDISAAGEYERPTVDDLLSANFSRLQESLRSLEEFSKMLDPQAARQFEQLRYQGYMLHKDVAFPISGRHTSTDLPGQ